MKKPAIHSQPVDIPRRNPDIVPRRTSLYRIMPLIQYQLINRSKEYTMASVHDKLQCCLLLPRTQQNKTPKPTHTRDPRRRRTKHRRGQHKNKGRLFQLIRIFHRKIGVSGNWNCHHSAKVSRLLQNLIQDSKVALHFQSQKYSCWIHIHGTKTKVETLRSREN